MKKNLGPPEGEGSDKSKKMDYNFEYDPGKAFQCCFICGVLIGSEDLDCQWSSTASSWQDKMGRKNGMGTPKPQPLDDYWGDDDCGCEGKYGVDDDWGEVRHIDCPLGK